MKRIFGLFAIAVLVVVLSSQAIAKPMPLVSVDWLMSHANVKNLVVLDVRSDPLAFGRGHIPGAVFTHYGRDGWRTTIDGVPGMLPDTKSLETLIGRLGIAKDSHVILVATGNSMPEMATATRIYWTFKTLGHDAVSILDGGMAAYVSKGGATEKGMASKTIEPATFKAKKTNRYLADAATIKMALNDSDVVLLDNRPIDMFVGNRKSGKVARPGTLPGAVSVPGPMLMTRTMMFRNAQAVRGIYGMNQVDTMGKPVIVFCNSGHYASLGWFVEHEILGNKNAKLYDGSLADWARVPSNPMVVLAMKK